MTTQIDVVDINTNDNIEKNDTNLSEEVKQEDATPKAKTKATSRARAKAPVKVEVEPEEVTPDEVKPEEVEETKPEEVEETKPEHRNRPELKVKVNCPDCGKELATHGLKYTHTRYCKAKQPARVEPPVLETRYLNYSQCQHRNV